MRQTLVVAGFLTVSVVSHVGAARGQTAENGQLYACADATTAGVPELGITLCDATATPELERRAEEDNLQSRDGARVVSLDDAGVSAKAGLQPGDVIYRVGGVNVDTAEAAAEILSQIGTRSDTIVNFLRGGRPYRVKLRRN